MECRAEKDCGLMEPKSNIEWAASTELEWRVGRKGLGLFWSQPFLEGKINCGTKRRQPRFGLGRIGS